MRNIKFKVWDKDKGEWLELGEDNFITYDGEKMKVIEGDENYGILHENVEILQWTGLVDKNGKEVYEGDIFCHNLYKNAIGIVTYGKYSGHTGFYINWIKGVHKELFLRDLAHWAAVSEVIGNIYENPYFSF